MIFEQKIHCVNRKGVDTLILKLLKENYNYDQWFLYMFGYYDENHHEFLFFEFIKVNFKADSSNSSKTFLKTVRKL